jgi:predicted nucleic acid-binding protein
VSYLLDTNVVSERLRPRPDPRIRDWFASVANEDLYISALVVGEVTNAAESLRRRDPLRATRYQEWLDGLVREYGPRILPITPAIVAEWGKMGVPDPVPVIDGLMAATAKVHGLTFVTRNTNDVARTGVRLLNPFSA